MAKTVTVSYSELDCYRQCPFKHELGYKERWVSPTLSPALSRGTLTHAVLEDHYREKQRLDEAGKNHRPTPIDEELMRLTKAHLSVQTEETDLVHWMIEGYLSLYGWDAGWRVLAVEHAPEIWLPGPNGGRSRFKLKLKIDLVIQDRRTGKIWIVDHKTGRQLPKNKQLDINDQFGLYAWAMRQLGKPVFGQLHNGIRTDRLKREMSMDERFSRIGMFRTDTELDAIAADAYKTARIAYSTPLGEAGRSPDDDRCGWRCDYTDACLMGRKMGDNQATRTFLFDAGFRQDFTRH